MILCILDELIPGLVWSIGADCKGVCLTCDHTQEIEIICCIALHDLLVLTSDDSTICEVSEGITIGLCCHENIRTYAVRCARSVRYIECTAENRLSKLKDLAACRIGTATSASTYCEFDIL